MQKEVQMTVQCARVKVCSFLETKFVVKGIPLFVNCGKGSPREPTEDIEPEQKGSPPTPQAAQLSLQSLFPLSRGRLHVLVGDGVSPPRLCRPSCSPLARLVAAPLAPLSRTRQRCLLVGDPPVGCFQHYLIALWVHPTGQRSIEIAGSVPPVGRPLSAAQ